MKFCFLLNSSLFFVFVSSTLARFFFIMSRSRIRLWMFCYSLSVCLLIHSISRVRADTAFVATILSWYAPSRYTSSPLFLPNMFFNSLSTFYVSFSSYLILATPMISYFSTFSYLWDKASWDLVTFSTRRVTSSKFLCNSRFSSMVFVFSSLRML